MNNTNPTPDASHDNDAPALVPLAIRGGIGGVLMGLANLVPGISGGTMLLAAGIYPRFISAIGEITTGKFRKASLVVLGAVVLAAGLAVVGLAGPVKELVVNHRWIMYSLFIGLTLGGVPVVWRLVREAGGNSKGVVIGGVIGFLGMAALAYVQMKGAGGVEKEGFWFMLLAGVAGASAMILPGVSGGYLLLVLGVYVPILAAISGFKEALKAGDTDAVLSIGLSTILPVGLGVIVGIVVVSNLLKWLLKRYERPTLGVLLGLLLGAVVGLYPFVQGVEPKVGDKVKGQLVTVNTTHDAEHPYQLDPSGKALEPDDYPVAVFSPGAGHIGGALALVLGGFGATLLIDRFGAERKTVARETD